MEQRQMQEIMKRAEIGMMLERVANMMADYRTSLRAAGISEELADRLVLSANDRLFEASMNMATTEIEDKLTDEHTQETP